MVVFLAEDQHGSKAVISQIKKRSGDMQPSKIYVNSLISDGGDKNSLYLF